MSSSRAQQTFKCDNARGSCEFQSQTASDLSICGKCKNVKYCSVDCQKQHWKDHKLTCVEIFAQFVAPQVDSDVSDSEQHTTENSSSGKKKKKNKKKKSKKKASKTQQSAVDEKDKSIKEFVKYAREGNMNELDIHRMVQAMSNQFDGMDSDDDEERDYGMDQYMYEKHGYVGDYGDFPDYDMY